MNVKLLLVNMQFKIHPHNSVTLCKYNFHPNLFFPQWLVIVTLSNMRERNCGGNFIFNVGKKCIGEVLRMANFGIILASDTGTDQIPLNSKIIANISYLMYLNLFPGLDLQGKLEITQSSILLTVEADPKSTLI